MVILFPLQVWGGGEIGFDGLTVSTNFGEIMLYSGYAHSDNCNRVFCNFADTNEQIECVYNTSGELLIFKKDDKVLFQLETGIETDPAIELRSSNNWSLGAYWTR